MTCEGVGGEGRGGGKAKKAPKKLSIRVLFEKETDAVSVLLGKMNQGECPAPSAAGTLVMLLLCILSDL